MNYKWVSVYKDGSILEQFDGDREVLFNEIELEKLKYFKVINDNLTVVLDMERGVFRINNTPLSIKGFSDSELDYRLVYFKRNYNNMSTMNISDTQRTKYFLGYQVTVDDTNYKILLEIKDDNVELEIQ